VWRYNESQKTKVCTLKEKKALIIFAPCILQGFFSAFVLGVENTKEVSFDKEKRTKNWSLLFDFLLVLPWDIENAQAQGHFLENHCSNQACEKALSQPSFLFLSLSITQKLIRLVSTVFKRRYKQAQSASECSVFYYPNELALLAAIQGDLPFSDIRRYMYK